MSVFQEGSQKSCYWSGSLPTSNSLFGCHRIISHLAEAYPIYIKSSPQILIAKKRAFQMSDQKQSEKLSWQIYWIHVTMNTNNRHSPKGFTVVLTSVLLGLRFPARKRNLWWVSFIIPIYVVYHNLWGLSRGFWQKYVFYILSVSYTHLTLPTT